MLSCVQSTVDVCFWNFIELFQAGMGGGGITVGKPTYSPLSMLAPMLLSASRDDHLDRSSTLVGAHPPILP